MQNINEPSSYSNDFIWIDGQKVRITDLIEEHKSFSKENREFNQQSSKAKRCYNEVQELKPYQAELIKLQKHIENTNQKMIILFEGRDAAGKGGTIRRVTRYMNEKHYRVVALGKPTEEQRSQWYFQRYVGHFPHAGEIVLFDRSWYNRSMVEPVFGFCTPDEYTSFMQGVKGFEKDIARYNTIIIKLYFSVTREEQARRFAKRMSDPLRQWKLSEVDLQAQDRWDDFTAAKYKMLKRSHSHETPWTVIRSDNKHNARIETIKVILNSIDYKDRDETLNFTCDSEVVISGSREIEHMEAHRMEEGKFLW